MDIDQNAPITSRGSVDVAASPLEVWAVLSDIGRWPTWNPDVTRGPARGRARVRRHVRLAVGPGTMQVGAPLRGGRARARLDGDEQGRARHLGLAHRADRRGSRVTVEESWSGWPARLMHKRFGRSLRGRLVEGLHNLKTEAEFRSRRDLRLAA